MVGLMDTRALVTCIGGRLASELLSGPQYKTMISKVRTADAMIQNIFGRVSTEVTYRGETETILLYLVLSLTGKYTFRKFMICYLYIKLMYVELDQIIAIGAIQESSSSW